MHHAPCTTLVRLLYAHCRVAFPKSRQPEQCRVILSEKPFSLDPLGIGARMRRRSVLWPAPMRKKGDARASCGRDERVDARTPHCHGLRWTAMGPLPWAEMASHGAIALGRDGQPWHHRPGQRWTAMALLPWAEMGSHGIIAAALATASAAAKSAGCSLSAAMYSACVRKSDSMKLR